jgi:hypothetical protein
MLAIGAKSQAFIEAFSLMRFQTIKIEGPDSMARIFGSTDLAENHALK